MAFKIKIFVFVVFILPSISAILIGFWSYAIGHDVPSNMIGTLIGLVVTHTAIYFVIKRLAQQYYK
jgi:hypothetical protein